MAKKDNIPAGYQLQITSWENDADCYKTQVFSGLTKEDCKFLIELGKLFRSDYRVKKGEKAFGGGSGRDVTMEEVMDAYDAVIQKHQDKITPSLLEQFKVDRDEEYAEDGYNENITELVGYPEEDYYSEIQYFRVFDSYEVFYHPGPVQNVTSEFK